jgi:1-acyl-sn-glycerol-3-phosphate acyltransferase
MTTQSTNAVALSRFQTWLRLIVGFVVVMVCASISIVFALLLLPWRLKRIQVGNLYGKVVGPILVWLSGSRPVFKNREFLAAQGPAIYVSNHVSIVDLMLGMWLTPLGGCGTAKKEIAKVPFFGWLYRLSGHILLDRGDRDRAIATLNSAAEFVRSNGVSIWIWPEGTRSRDGRLSPFKKGFVHLAIATGLPVVPVVVYDAHHRWPADTFVMYPGDLHIEILDKIDTSAWSEDRVAEHAQQVHDAFVTVLSPGQRPLTADSSSD